MERPVTNIRPGVGMVLRTMLTPCVFGVHEEAELQRLQAKLGEIKRANPDDFDPIEQFSKKRDLIIPKFEGDIRALQEEASGFQRINPRFLSWNNPETGLGFFGIADIKDPKGEFCIHYDPRWTNISDATTITPNIPPEWVRQLRQTIGTLARLSKNKYEGRSIRISSTFSPVFPPDVRQNIKRAKELGIFDGGIFVVYQVPEWEIELGRPQVIPTDDDPIVIGHSNKTGVSRLIRAFFPTEFENAVLGV